MVEYFINNFKAKSLDSIKPLYQTKSAVRKKAYSMVSGRSKYVKIGVIQDATYRPGKEAYYLAQVTKDPYDSSKLIYVEYGRADEEWLARYLNKDGSLGAKAVHW